MRSKAGSQVAMGDSPKTIRFGDANDSIQYNQFLIANFD